MNLLDIILLIVTVTYGIAGYWQGFIAGAAATVGLLAGGVAGISIAPWILGGAQPSVAVSLGALFIVLLAASVGQAAGSFLGGRVRDTITWHPVRSLDAAGGAALSMTAVMVVAWALGYALTGARIPVLGSEVRSSYVLAKIDAVMPGSAASVLGAFNRIVGSDLFPRYLEPFAPERIVPVPPPDQGVVRAADVRRASGSVVKVIGDASSCDRSIEGSGFFYAPGRVMTNAHVVAGVRSPNVVIDGRPHRATVVLYDSSLDVAVLAVPGVSEPALRFDTHAHSKDSAAVLGYPQDGPFRSVPARVRSVEQLRSPNIYSDGTVVREVVSIRAVVRPGNSGGPLVSPAGSVYGVVFAASINDRTTGYALSAEQVSADAGRGRSATGAVSTGGCA
ncbi:MAG: MarP family serine protease [Nocardioidaceae bacterium]